MKKEVSSRQKVVRTKPSVCIVVPCLNEEECLSETITRLLKKLNALYKKRRIKKDSWILVVDDGSTDKTWEIVEKFAEKKQVSGIKLARNFGHQNALLAGLVYAGERADAIVSIDADLQDDINAIDEMIEKYLSGVEIVFGVRKDRKTDSWFKRRSARRFYKLMNWLGAKTLEDSADYRLMSKRAIEELGKFKEVNLFLRGVVPELGFKTAVVEYSRGERFAGKSKYSLRKMINFALEGITSFSVKPIRLLLILGIIIAVVSFGILIYAIIVKFTGGAVPGWAFIVCSVWLLGGAQMVGIGIVGEYIGKVYLEAKARPRYTIEKIIGPKASHK